MQFGKIGNDVSRVTVNHLHKKAARFYLSKNLHAHEKI